jgi:hypothetical protein
MTKQKKLKLWCGFGMVVIAIYIMFELKPAEANHSCKDQNLIKKEHALHEKIDAELQALNISID